MALALPLPVNKKTLAKYRVEARSLVRSGRLRLKLTQAKLAAAISLSQGEVSRIESGVVEVPVWLYMYFMHIFPDLIVPSQQHVEQLRKVASFQIESADEVAIKSVLAVLRR